MAASCTRTGGGRQTAKPCASPLSPIHLTIASDAGVLAAAANTGASDSGKTSARLPRPALSSPCESTAER